ncbi:MAG: molybdate ABC transporter substrate-binding protein [Burkholderiales bacterium]|nr:molybdate ABC transporter substrate-binding protein [Zoogloeaceae bacterium]MBV6410453.1 Molybdate-binding protein ModA [Rhodocyclaceae bacterium]MCZ2418604.1 molybdate ABC transporter substrate-binding protein [Burkholderiales bacterium]HNQ58164.1 molybdate ABC transporter substrate-binding protein [Candidatus Desulfobacillus denitrificans]MCQ3922850.1 molybdate ABC transporter substrate-binding protein [Rhodocyclaceae bacterium]
MPLRFDKWLLAAAMALFGASVWAAELTVSAAASLTDAFREIARGYEAQHPGARVLLNFGASGALLQQIAKGAPVDVFASADQETMDQAQQQDLIAERRDFTRNALVLILPADSRLAPGALGDLAQDGVKRIAIGNPAVAPIGRYARRALENAKLWTAVESKIIHAQNVRQALDYVARSEVDAGFVFATDAAVMKDKVKVAFKVAPDVPMRYPIARIAASPNAGEAKRFVAYVLSPAGQAVLARHGFLQP